MQILCIITYLLESRPEAIWFAEFLPFAEQYSYSIFSKPLTNVMSREAAAALMCKLGCLTELLQSKARANVPTALGGKKRKRMVKLNSHIYVKDDLSAHKLKITCKIKHIL